MQLCALTLWLAVLAQCCMGLDVVRCHSDAAVGRVIPLYPHITHRPVALTFHALASGRQKASQKASARSPILHYPLLLPRLARASRGALPTQRRARLRVIVFSNPSHSSDTKARAAMDGGAPRG
jgi:hypothetical protein